MDRKKSDSVTAPVRGRTWLLIALLAALAMTTGALALKAANPRRASRTAPVAQVMVPTSDGTLQAAPPAPEPEPEPAAQTGRLRVSGAGDIMLQRRINRSVRQKAKGDENNFGYDGLFQDLDQALADVDFATANMEFPVFDKTLPERALVFHGEAPALKAIMRAGFDVITSANNHAYDHGRAGPESTKRLCDAAGMVCLGVGATQAQAEEPYIVEKNGITLAFIGYTMLYNSNQNRSDPDAARVNGYKWDDLVRQVKAASARADAVIVNVHWGQEYRTTALKWQPQQARALFDAGATVIFGHHPHVLEPIQLMEAADGRKCLVAYSLSNFVSNQNGSSPEAVTRLGAIVKVDLVKTERGVEVDTWTSDASWIFNRDVKVDGKTIEDVHVEVVSVEIGKLKAELEEETDPAKQAEIKRSISFYEGRQAHAEKILRHPHGKARPEPEPSKPVAEK